MNTLSYNQKRFQKIAESVFLLVLFSVCMIQAMFSFKNPASFFSKGNDVSVEASQDGTTMKLGFNNLCAPTSKVLLSKNFCDGKFHYSVSSLESGDEILNFESTSDIVTNGFSVRNNNLCAAVASFVHAIVHHQNPWGAVGAAFGSAAGLISEGTLGAMVALVGEAGLASIPAVIGLLSASEGIIVALGVGGLA